MTEQSGVDLSSIIRDVRYTQEFLYPSFSNGAMTVAETYVILELNILDPASLPPMVIFKYDDKYWCRDTRRMMIAKALLEANRFSASGNMQCILVTGKDKEYRKQYQNLIDERLPSMKRKGIDGTTVKISTKKGPTSQVEENRPLRTV